MAAAEPAIWTANNRICAASSRQCCEPLVTCVDMALRFPIVEPGGTLCKGRRHAGRRTAAAGAVLNALLTESEQRDHHLGRLGPRLGWERIAMKSVPRISRVRVYEALALAGFAGLVVFFVERIVPLIAAN